MAHPKGSAGGSGRAAGGLVKSSGQEVAAAPATPRRRESVLGSFRRARGPQVDGVIRRERPPAPPAKGGSITRMLRQGQRGLYRAEQDRMRALGGDVAGMRLIRRNIRKGAAAKAAGATGSGNARPGSIREAMRSTLRELARSDARYYREMGQILGSGKSGRGTLGGTRKRRALPGS